MIGERERQREEIKKLRREQPDEERYSKSLAIRERLFSLPEFRDAPSIAFYASTSKEVDTNSMIDFSLGMRSLSSLKIRSI